MGKVCGGGNEMGRVFMTNYLGVVTNNLLICN